MKWWKTIFLSSFIILFCLILTFSLFSFTLSEITTKENLKVFAGSVLNQELRSTKDLDLEKGHTLLLAQCEFQDKIEIPLEIQTVTISCSDIKASTQTTFVSLVINRFVDAIYDKDFGCSFLECMQKLNGTDLAFMMLSNTGHQFYTEVSLAFIVLLLIIGTLIIFTSEPKIAGIKSIGICIIIVGLGYFAFLYAKALLLSNVELLSITPALFEILLNNFLILFIIGIIVTMIGYYVLHHYERRMIEKEE